MTTNDTEPLLLNVAAVCRILGGIHPKTLARLEARGLIRSVKLIRHKLYPFEEVTKLVTNLKSF